MADHNEADIDELIGMQLVAYDQASNLQRVMFWLAVGIAAIGIFLVFNTSHNVGFTLGAIALLLSMLSAYLSHKLNHFRTFAERVRKATLLTKGLGFSLSKFERQKIRSDFPGKVKTAQSRVDKEYFASKSQHGPKRLAEMLEESAFWSKHLLDISAKKTWLYVLFSCATTVGLLLGYIYFGHAKEASRDLKAIQAIMTGLTLLISRDFLGKALAYSGAERAVSDILLRLQTLKERNNADLLHDLYLVLGDYNSAVESAPLFLPGLHEKYKSKLNELWKKYI